jgi:hypothetical protein
LGNCDTEFIGPACLLLMGSKLYNPFGGIDRTNCEVKQDQKAESDFAYRQCFNFSFLSAGKVIRLHP